jgi:hypothetical protein
MSLPLKKYDMSKIKLTDASGNKIPFHILKRDTGRTWIIKQIVQEEDIKRLDRKSKTEAENNLK